MAKAKANTEYSKDWQTRTGATGFDAQTQAMIDQIMRTTNAAAAGGAPPSVTGAQDFYGGATAAGATGLKALGGDTTAMQGLMSPYQQQVIDAANAQWDKTDKGTLRDVNDAATAARAFGGSRAAVTQGAALATNTLNRNSQVANLLQSGYADATNRAAQLAQFGFGGAGAGANLGMLAGNPDLWRLSVLKQGFSGLPYGTTSTQGYTGTSIGGKGELALGV